MRTILTFISAAAFVLTASAQDIVQKSYKGNIMAETTDTRTAQKFDIFSTQNILKKSYASQQEDNLYPYIVNFDSYEDIADFMVEDANKDGNSWFYYIHYVMYSHASSGYTADDWLFTKGLQVTKGTKYHLSFSVQTATATEKIEVFAGNDCTSDVMKQEIVPETEVSTNREWQTISATFIAEETTTLYIGFHACSDPGSSTLCIDNLFIDEGAAEKGPQTVNNLRITPGARGQLSATLSFDAPTLDMSGNELPQDGIDSITIARQGMHVKTITNPAPGENIVFEDNGETTPVENGINSYELITFGKQGKGDVVSQEVYIGIDTPVAIDNIIMQASEDKALIVWFAPSEGIHGGYVSSNTLKYDIVRFNSQGTYEFVATDLQTTLYEDPLPEEGTQLAYYYGISAKNEAGAGEYAYTEDVIVAGAPYKPKFTEPFSYYDEYAKQNLPSLNTSIWVSDMDWMLSEDDDYVSSQDNGMLVFKPSTENAKHFITTPIITLAEEINPVLELNLFIPENSNASLDLNYSVYKESTLSNITTIFDEYNTELKKGEWNKVSINISKLAGWGEVKFQFSATGNTPEDMLYIDDVVIYDNIPNDVAITGISGERIIKAGETVHFNVVAENKGTADSQPCNVLLYCNDELISENNLDILSPGDTCTVSLEYTPTEDDINTCKIIRAELDITDEKTFNNKSEELEAFIDAMPYAPVTDLNAKEKGGYVVLDWSVPAYQQRIDKRIDDDIEAYEDFIIEGIGEYTLIDGDKQQTYGISMHSWPNIYEPQSFIVFNPHKANMDLSLDAGWTPHSGEKMLVCFDAINTDPDNIIPNDDWLITPEVKPNTLFSFWTKSPNTVVEPEQLEVLYSPIGTAVEDFIPLEPEVIEVPAQWTQYIYLLPADAKHVALHCVSAARFALLVDDISFTANEEEILRLKGYNVYRDGVCITKEPIGTNTFTDKDVEKGMTYYYEIETVYEQGVSPLSNMANILFEKSIIDNESEISIYTTDNKLFIENAGNEVIKVYTPQGLMLYNGNGNDYRPLELAQGIYIVTTGHETAKVLVK